MSQDQLQIFHAAFKPRLKSPKNTRERELDKLLYRESQNLEAAHRRIHRMQKDEEVSEHGDQAQLGQTLLEKIRAEDAANNKTANDRKEEDERRLRDEQKKMHKFVQSFMASVDLKVQKASPSKIQKTGNVVLDKINQEVEEQRQFQIELMDQEELRVQPSLSAQADGSAVKTPAIVTSHSLNQDETAKEPEKEVDPAENPVTDAGSPTVAEVKSNFSSPARDPLKPKLVTQSTVMDTMLETGNKQVGFNKPALYKIDAFKEYRNQLGLNLIRNKDLAHQSGKRSQHFQLQQAASKEFSPFQAQTTSAAKDLSQASQSPRSSQQEASQSNVQGQDQVNNDSLYEESLMQSKAQSPRNQQPENAIAISREFILAQGRFPQNSLRKPRFKKDATNLRGKGSQYQELTQALDLLLDGPSIKDTTFIKELNAHSNQLLPPELTNSTTRKTRQRPMAKSMHHSSIQSPFGATAGEIVGFQDQSKYLPSLQKQKVLNKFFEVATMQDPVPQGTLVSNFNSSKVTAAIVNQVSKEHHLIQAQILQNRQVSRQTTGDQRHKESTATGHQRANSQHISIPQINMTSHSQQRTVPPASAHRTDNDVDVDQESQMLLNQPLTVQVPFKVGPTKNIYQFTQLRDTYKNKFIQTAQMMNKLDASINQVDTSLMGQPKITGAYASLINSDLHEDLTLPRSNSNFSQAKVTSLLLQQSQQRQQQPDQLMTNQQGPQNQVINHAQHQSMKVTSSNSQAATPHQYSRAIDQKRQSKSQLSADLLDTTMHSYYGNIDVANRTVNHASQGVVDGGAVGAADQTSYSFQQHRQASLPSTQKKRKAIKVDYSGMTKDQIRRVKKEKRQRREWNKYKEKLIEQRNEVTKQFHSNYYWNSYVIQAQNSRRSSKPDQPVSTVVNSPNNETYASGMHLRVPKYAAEDTQPPAVNYVHLQDVITDSCSFYEKMEKQKEGSIERMLTDLRTKIDKGKVNVDKRQHYDPKR